MRNLFVLRGIPGSGKSTFIKEHNLENYTICPDKIRLMFSCPRHNLDGTQKINSSNDTEVWKLVNHLIEKKMDNGELIIIDATSLNTKTLHQYKNLAEKYKYHKTIIDFTDVDIKTAKERNRNREEYKRVPDYVIDKFYEKINESIPSGYNIIKPEEFSVEFKPIDLNKYKKIHVFGDIHGCFSTLMKYFVSEHTGNTSEFLKDDEFYIFLGDYLDRGLENAEMFKFISGISENKNVLLLEGNHEKHLFHYSYGEKINGEQFTKETLPQLEKAGLNKKDAKKLYKKCAQCAYFEYNGNFYVCCHGGISFVPDLSTPTSELIKGIGTYPDADTVDEFFINNTLENYISVHGHRNVYETVPTSDSRTFNLESKCELGGYLSVLQISSEGRKCVRIKNSVYDEELALKHALKHKNINTVTTKDAVKMLASDSNIKVKDFGAFSSYNFSREVFQKGSWNDRTVKARGLFVDNKSDLVIARGFEKFFNYGEHQSTSPEELKKNLVFPVTAYVKENGFLGMLSTYKGSLFFTTKTNPESKHCDYFKKIFKNLNLSQKKIRELTHFLEENEITLLFEVIDPVNDPHIINYESPKLVLLSAVYNKIQYQNMPYDELCNIAEHFGFEVKERASVFNNFDELAELIHQTQKLCYTYKGKYIEGFVLEDSNGFQFKLKTAYYLLWKRARSIANSIRKYGNAKGIPEELKEFSEFFKNNYDRNSTDEEISIIEWRNKFMSR